MAGFFLSIKHMTERNRYLQRMNNNPNTGF